MGAGRPAIPLPPRGVPVIRRPANYPETCPGCGSPTEAELRCSYCGRETGCKLEILPPGTWTVRG